MSVVRLEEATRTDDHGGKAVELGNALRNGLPVPAGYAVSVEITARIAAHDRAAGALVEAALANLPFPVAARSSGVGEDGTATSFAGQHLTIVNLTSAADVLEAIARVHASAQDASALAYRERMGLQGAPGIAVVLQRVVAASVAGVLFTRDPVTGAKETVIEAAWGLGEAVVSGLVTPDRWRLASDGAGFDVLEELPGVKDVEVRLLPGGGTETVDVAADRIERPCLGARELAALAALGARCEVVLGGPVDIEWAFTPDGSLFLLQQRPITT